MSPVKTVSATLAAFVSVKAIWLAAMVVVVGSFPLADLMSFDAGWYLGVLVDGYSGTERSNLAFFPLLPTLAKLPLAFGVSPEWSLLAVAWLGSILAVIGIQRVGAALGTESLGFWLAFCWAVAPRSHVQVLAYSEGLFTACVAWCLWAMVTQRTFLAGAMCFLAGLTRPAALPLIAVLWLWWLVGIVAARHAASWGEKLRLDRFGAAVLGSAGFAGYWLYVASRTGSITGYLDVQRSWNSVAGNPLKPLHDLWLVLRGQLPGADWTAHGTVTITLIGVMILLVVMVITREHWLATALVVLGLGLTLTQQDYYHAKARMMLPWFTVWLPVARWLADLSLKVALPVAVIAVAGSTLWEIDGALYRWSP